jgi:hypothetical protein
MAGCERANRTCREIFFLHSFAAEEKLVFCHAVLRREIKSSVGTFLVDIPQCCSAENDHTAEMVRAA